MAKQWVLVEAVVPDPNARPEHPIVLPPEGAGDAHPEHPIVLPPPIPAHPIVLPPLPTDPDHIWGGANEPFPGTGLPGDQPEVGEPGFPTPPIVIVPPQDILPDIPDGQWLVVVMTPEGDLEWALVPEGGPPGNLPPSTQPV